MMRLFFSCLRGNKGSILILTFWALSFLAFFAAYMGIGSRQRLALVSRLNQRDELRLAAEAGIQKGVVELKKEDEDPGTDSLKERWAHSESLFKDVKVGNAFFSLKIVDEERKINVNVASMDTLKRLFKALWNWPDTEAEVLAAAIIDWRDEDDSSLPQGAEKSFYENLKYPYGCKNAKCDILDELLLVRGVTATIYKDLESYVTVYGRGVVNVNTASRPVLIACGIDEKLAEKIIAFRNDEDLQEGTPDDRVFSGPSTIVAQLSQFVPLDSQEVAQLSNIVSLGLLGTTSENFMIASRASYGAKKGEVFVSCVFKREPLEAGGYKGKNKYWRIGG